MGGGGVKDSAQGKGCYYGRLGAGSVGFRGKRMVARWEGVVLKTVHKVSSRDVTIQQAQN